MSKYHNDRAIDGSNTAPDRLNRERFANNLSGILTLEEGDDCLVVSLEGEWGYGKTSVINLVKSALGDIDHEKPIIVEFNPWLTGDPQSLVEDFLDTVSKQLDLRNSSALIGKAAKELKTYSKLFRLTKLIPGAELPSAIIEQVFAAAGDAAGDIATLKSGGILDKKKKVMEAIEAMNTPMIVIIDDIDRLTPIETFEILRLVKVVADFPRTAYLLAFDPEYLTTVLENHSITNTREYIEKIVQLRVPLPIISGADIMQIVELELLKFNDTDTGQFDEHDRFGWFYNEHARYLLRNPREVKRVFNHLRFTLNQVNGQVCFTDLFALSILAVKANSIYEHIKFTPQAYVGRSIGLDSEYIGDTAQERVNELQNERKELLKSFPTRDRPPIEDIVGELFPLIESNNFGMYRAYDPDAEGRVCEVKRLHIALHYETPTGSVSDQEVRLFISGELDRAEFVTSVLNSKAENRFFELVTMYASECSDSAELIGSISSVVIGSQTHLAERQAKLSILGDDIIRHLKWTALAIVRDSKNKLQLIDELISHPETALIAANIIDREYRHAKESSDDELWLTPDELKDLEPKYQDTLLKALSSKQYKGTGVEHELFYSFVRTSREKTSKYLTNMLEQQDGVLQVAEIVGRGGSDSFGGEYAQFDEKYYADLVDIPALKEAASKLDISKLPTSLAAVINSILDGKKYYTKDGSVGESF